MGYRQFLDSKVLKADEFGIDVSQDVLHSALFDYQKAIVQVALRKGRFAIFADVGLGKTLMQLEWAKQLNRRTIIFAPLAVAKQTIREAQSKLGYEVRYITHSSQIDIDCDLYITNYERLKDIDPAKFEAVVLDESSILKSFNGKTKRLLIEKFQDTLYRLSCTATPAPNDVNELGTQSEFLGVLGQSQMSSIFFVHEAGVFAGVKTSRWRLKSHAEKDFYRWLASWSCAIRKPSDLGFSDDNYRLPEVQVHDVYVDSNYTPEGMLPGFGMATVSAIDVKRIRKTTILSRAAILTDIVNNSDEQWIVWCALNEEGLQLEKALNDSINVEGKMALEDKVGAIEAFCDNRVKVLITKASIAGMGMNLQHCRNMVFFGLDFSWEEYYQCIGRINRFGQASEVINIYHVISEQTQIVYNTIKLKGETANAMVENLVTATREYTMEELQKNYKEEWKYQTDIATSALGNWTLMLGDSVERMREIADNSINLSVYSPPFSDMYVYNATERDLSNSKNLDEFFAHYDYIIRENLRITMPGRIACVHVQDPKTFKGKEGFRGIYDFTGMVIQAYIDAGWIYRSRITIDKNPQIVASRNKDSDLLFITGKRDSANLAPMATDYMLIFRKPGDNLVPVTPYANHEMSEDDWITWAHAVWYDIRETDVLNVRQAKGDKDNKHMCPLQLPIIERCLKLWSNPNELIFSPFAGIGSEGYEAVRLKRRFVGIELKPEYYRVAIQNLNNAERLKGKTLFDLLDEVEAEKVE